jgi:hypothetical protein
MIQIVGFSLWSESNGSEASHRALIRDSAQNRSKY